MEKFLSNWDGSFCTPCKLLMLLLMLTLPILLRTQRGIVTKLVGIKSLHMDQMNISSIPSFSNPSWMLPSFELTLTDS